jgi:hypothetical protein
MRIHVLEHRIGVLEKSKQSQPAAEVQARAALPALPVLGRVKLGSDGRESVTIEGASDQLGRSSVGVPWDVDRGMLMDGAQRNSPMQNIRRETESGNGVINGQFLERPLEWPITELPQQTPRESSKSP